MTRAAAPARYAVLPGRGVCLAAPDLHGNLEDFLRLQALFLQERQASPDAHLVLLGDLVHGPDTVAREQWPELYDYPDESWAVVEGVVRLKARHPGQVHLVLGNHDHGHVGGSHPSKFHPDEVAHLERGLTASQLGALQELFRAAMLLVLCPCGVLLSHGSPGGALSSLERVSRLSLAPEENGPEEAGLLRTLLQSYGQSPEVTAGVLAALSRETGLPLALVVHGHDRDEMGYYSEGENQLCPVIFGAPRSNKRYLRMDLSARYRGASDMRDGLEIRKLY